MEVHDDEEAGSRVELVGQRLGLRSLDHMLGELV